MYYMNTDRDNFHDWARDKPDTSFGVLQRADGGNDPKARGAKWGRLVLLAMLGIALAIGFRLLAGS
jgi:hypothetical protein